MTGMPHAAVTCYTLEMSTPFIPLDGAHLPERASSRGQTAARSTRGAFRYTEIHAHEPPTPKVNRHDTRPSRDLCVAPGGETDGFCCEGTRGMWQFLKKRKKKIKKRRKAAAL